MIYIYKIYNLRSPVPVYTPFIRAHLHFLCSMLNMQQALNSHYQYHHKTALSDHPWLSPSVAICSLSKQIVCVSWQFGEFWLPCLFGCATTSSSTSKKKKKLLTNKIHHFQSISHGFW